MTAKKTKSKVGERPNKNPIKNSSTKIGIIPLADRVILEEYKEKAETSSGIFLPDNISSDKDSKKGKVVAVGPGKYDDGILVPMSVKVGDVVIYSWGDNVKVNGNEYTIVRDGDITAIIE